MTSVHNSFNALERGSWLEDCIGIVRDAVLGRRASLCRTMPEAIEQSALDLRLPVARTKALFYREVFFVRREFWVAMKTTAIEECTRRSELLQERTEAALAKRAQHELDLGLASCSSFGGRGRNSAPGEGTDV